MRIFVVAGARPNFMKVAPVIDAFQHYPQFQVFLIHTGQHYDSGMSGSFFKDLGIPEPHINLGVGSGSHAVQTAGVMIGFEQICIEERPDWVIVVGDINSTLACALTARKMGIRVAHVEAGLRSGDMSMPEEINRLCTDAISDLLFTTDEGAGANLLREGVSPGKIHLVGNTMIDTLLKHLDQALAAPLPLTLLPKSYAVVTLHRPGNVDRPDRLKALLDVLQRIGGRLPIVFPIHPRTRLNLKSLGLIEQIAGHPNIVLLDPLSYLPFIGLVARSRLVLTDSGGIQEETTVLNIPCLTMRENTERPVTCNLGTNILVGTDPERVWAAVQHILDGGGHHAAAPEFWDGHAAERIAQVFAALPPDWGA